MEQAFFDSYECKWCGNPTNKEFCSEACKKAYSIKVKHSRLQVKGLPSLDKVNKTLLKQYEEKD